MTPVMTRTGSLIEGSSVTYIVTVKMSSSDRNPARHTRPTPTLNQFPSRQSRALLNRNCQKLQDAKYRSAAGVSLCDADVIP